MPIRTWLTVLALAAGLAVRMSGADAAGPAMDSKREAMRSARTAAPAAQAPAPRTAAGPRAAIQLGTVTIASPADATRVPRYGKVELLVAVSTSSTRPYDPDPASGGVDLVATFTPPAGTSPSAAIAMPGFYDGSAWRVRFAPDRTGTWSYAVSVQDATGTVGSTTGQFTVVASASRGWVRIAGKQLAYADGTPFVGFGHNTGWQSDVEQPTMATMATLGENVLSFWLATPWMAGGARAPIENAAAGIGVYNQAACAYLDQLIGRAEANGILLLPSIWAHDQLSSGSGSWANNAYSALIDPGTSLAITPADFFRTTVSGADTAQWRYQRNFYRYLTARWGYSTALLGWVGVVEIDGTTGYAADQAQAAAWCRAVQDQFAATDPYRTAGGAFPIAFSKTDENAGAVAFDNGFALRAVDSYASKTSDLGIAYTIASETQTMHGSGKPCFHTEFGGALSATPPTATEPLHFHDGIWAGLNAGAAITPLKWGDGGSWPLLTDATYGAALQNHMSYLSHYARTIPYLGAATLGDVALSDTATSTFGTGQALSDRGFAWLLRATGPIGGGSVTVPALQAGTYAVRWYETWSADTTGTAAADAVVGAGGTLALPIAGSTHSDLAVRFQRRPLALAQTVNVVQGTTRIVTLAGDAGTGRLDTPTITRLPTLASLAQTVDGATAGAAIGAAPTQVSNAAFMLAVTAGPATGSDSFAFTLHDDLATSTEGTVTVRVVGPNHAPSFAKGADQTVAEDSASHHVATWATAISDNDPGQGQLLDFQISVDHPEFFSAGPTIDASNGALNFTTALHAHGTATLAIRLHDDGGTAAGGHDTSDPQTAAIVITHVNHAPVAQDAALDAYQDIPLALTLPISDVDHDALSYTIVGPSHGALGGTPPAMTYTPAAGYVGADSFTVSASDGQLSTATAATVAITVHPETPPTASGQQVALFQDTALGIVLHGSDPDSGPQPLAFAVATPPAHGTLSGTAPALTYTPAHGYVGADALAFTVSDGVATSAPATVRISVLSDGSSADQSANNGRCGLGHGIAMLPLLGWWLLRRLRLASRR